MKARSVAEAVAGLVITGIAVEIAYQRTLNVPAGDQWCGFLSCSADRPGDTTILGDPCTAAQIARDAAETARCEERESERNLPGHILSIIAGIAVGAGILYARRKA
jgi:hypothetical protein